jgi:hypothetical protein
MRKPTAAILAAMLITGIMGYAGAASASAQAPVVLQPPWSCREVAFVVKFKPALTLAGTGVASTFEAIGHTSGCKENPVTVQSTEGEITGFTGMLANNSCALLVPNNANTAPAMANGEVEWADNGNTTFTPSSNISFPAGNVITLSTKNKIELRWTGANMGTIGMGSLMTTNARQKVYLKTETVLSQAQLAAKCGAPKGLSTVTLKGSDH